MTSILLPWTTKSFQKEVSSRTSLLLQQPAAGGANWFIERFAVENGVKNQNGCLASHEKSLLRHREKTDQ